MAGVEKDEAVLRLDLAELFDQALAGIAMLAKDAGFEIIDADELANFDLEKFVRDHTRAALRTLKEQGIRPTMTATELLKMTRGGS